MTTATTRPTRARRVNPDTVAETEDPPFDTEEEKPVRRGRRAAAPAEEEDKPVRRKRTAAVERDDAEDDSDDEETIIPTFTGRAAITKARPQGESIYFTWGDDDDEPQIVKFLDVEPWAFNQHWVQRQGRQSFPCLGKGCPLCEIGQKASQRIVYDVVNLSLDEPSVQALAVGVSIDDDLSAYHADKKTGPLPRLWWALSRQKLAKPKGLQKYKYMITPIKDRDLEEDYGVNLEDAEDAVADAVPLDRVKVTGKVSRRVLQEIADDLME